MDMVDAFLLEDMKEMNWKVFGISNPRNAPVNNLLVSVIIPPTSAADVMQRCLSCNNLLYKLSEEVSTIQLRASQNCQEFMALL
jgi:uncharacterized protein with PIN domain